MTFLVKPDYLSFTLFSSLQFWGIAIPIGKDNDSGNSNFGCGNYNSTYIKIPI